MAPEHVKVKKGTGTVIKPSPIMREIDRQKIPR